MSTQRLTSDNYDRPKKTFQESLSNEEIKEKLKDYVKVENISEVPVNSHLRYFTLVEDPKTKQVQKLFRLGGMLKNKDNCDKYVVLSNGTKSWSVNTKTAVFFRKMTLEEVHDKYTKRIAELEHQVKRLTRKLKEALK
jgi:flagellar basal body rod protein FlgC